MKTGRRYLLTLAAVLLAPSGGAASEEPARPKAAGGEVWVRTELYFGTNRATGEVSEAEFSGFVDAHVTRLFPDGMTLLTGYGQFRNSNGVLIREKSYLLILLYPPTLRDANRRIQELRQIYKDTYAQESVLRVDSVGLVSF